jgi:DNA-binding transcriptional MerR regulator
MLPPKINPLVSFETHEPEPNQLYSIETAAQLTHVTRQMIAVYYKHGLVSPVMDPASGGWFFNDDGIRRLRRIQYLREACGMSLSSIEMILSLLDEVEELRREVRFLRQQ